MPDVESESNIRLIRGNNTANVTPYEDAVVFHSALGHLYDLVPGQSTNKSFRGVQVFAGLSVGDFSPTFDLTNRQVKVGAGRGEAFGRQFTIDAGTFEAVSYQATSGYLHVYVEIDTSANPETIAIRGQFGQSLTPTVTGGDDLYANEAGTGRAMLYTIAISNGNARILTDYREMRQPGVAPKALSMDADGTVDGVSIGTLLDGRTGYFRYARNADEADYATAIGTSSNSIKFGEKLMLDGQSAAGLLVSRAWTGGATSIGTAGLNIAENMENYGNILLGMFYRVTTSHVGIYDDLHWAGFYPFGAESVKLFAGNVSFPASDMPTFLTAVAELAYSEGTLKLRTLVQTQTMSSVAYQVRAVYLGVK